MDPFERLKFLSSQMAFEPDADHRASSPSSAPPSCYTPKEQDHAFVQPAQLPNGKHIMLLKTLLTSACERDCYYCPFRARRDFRRATLKPDEFASLFGKLSRAGAAQGIFLSSGIAGGGVRTQDRLLATAEILRKKIGFRGYLHLKIMPGAEKAQVERAMQLADRLSVNLEAPNSRRLALLAPEKNFTEELLTRLRWIEEIRRSQPASRGWNGRWPSTVTQFVAGGADEADIELMTTTAWLLKNVGLRRAYYSAFFPVSDTPLENKPAVDPLREHRLYQASFLLRDYGFDLEDLPFVGDGNLPLDRDPKLAWAEMNLAPSPLEVNHADRHQLMRVPGIGPRGADAILTARRTAALRDLGSLKKLGVIAERAAPYVLLDGRRPAAQLSLL